MRLDNFLLSMLFLWNFKKLFAIHKIYGIITSRNYLKIKDFGNFGEHCITSLRATGRAPLLVFENPLDFPLKRYNNLDVYAMLERKT